MMNTTRNDCAVKVYGGFKSDRRAFGFAKQPVGELLKNVLKDRGKVPQALNVRRTLRYVELSQY